MSYTALFDEFGSCLAVVDGNVGIIPHTYAVPTEEELSPDDIWFDGNAIQPREDIDLSVPAEMPVGVSLQIAAPAESRILINGEDIGALAVIDTSAPGTYAIRLSGRYRYRTLVEVIDGAEQAKRLTRAQLRAHQIANATPAQIDAYIDANVTDLASAKDFLKLLTKVVIIGRRKA